MNKTEEAKFRYYLQWDNHPRHSFRNICSLMEHQSLVDIAICCGNNTLHAHKCILAANSPYFKEELEKNSSIEQVVIVGFDFSVMKSIIEFMYCGQTTIADEHLKYLIAAAKLFRLRGLEMFLSEHQEFQISANEVFIPPPQFLTKKPKYPSAPHPFANIPMTNNNILKPINYSLNDPYNQRRFKRKYIRAEAEKACAKEAQASRLALANLQKEIASTPQVNSFIIEESCTETTVENFIPHSDESFVDNLNELHQVPVVDYVDLDSNSNDTKPPNMIQFAMQNHLGIQGLTTDKIKNILGNGIQSNVEIMFKTSEGNFVSVTDEVLQNLSRGGLQYQVVDENGQVGEIQDLHVLDRTVEKVETAQIDNTETQMVLPANEKEENVPHKPEVVPDDYINSEYLPSPAISDRHDNGSVNRSSGVNINPLETVGDNVYENSYNIQNSSLYENNHSNEAIEFVEKPIEFVPLNNEEYICTASSQENHEELPNPISTTTETNYYNLSATMLNGAHFMSSVNEIGANTRNRTTKKNSEKILEIRENAESSPKKTKFSPDIFFADLTNGDPSPSIVVDENSDLI